MPEIKRIYTPKHATRYKAVAAKKKYQGQPLSRGLETVEVLHDPLHTYNI